MSRTEITNPAFTADEGARALMRAMRATAEPPMLLLTADQAARALAVSARLLWARSEPRGNIPVVKIGKSIRYSVRALEAWIEKQQAECISKPKP